MRRNWDTLEQASFDAQGSRDRSPGINCTRALSFSRGVIQWISSRHQNLFNLCCSKRGIGFEHLCNNPTDDRCSHRCAIYMLVMRMDKLLLVHMLLNCN